MDLADTVALSAEHVNRTLQALRSDGLIQWERRRMRVLDVARLRAQAMFNPGYLRLDRGALDPADLAPERVTA